MSDQNDLTLPNLSQVDGSVRVDFGELATFTSKVRSASDELAPLLTALTALATAAGKVGSGQYADEIDNCYRQVIGHEAGPALRQAGNQLQTINSKLGVNAQTWRDADQAGATNLSGQLP